MTLFYSGHRKPEKQGENILNNIYMHYNKYTIYNEEANKTLRKFKKKSKARFPGSGAPENPRFNMCTMCLWFYVIN